MVPEGTILATGVRRIASFVLDTTIVNTILLIISKGKMINAWNLTL